MLHVQNKSETRYQYVSCCTWMLYRHTLIDNNAIRFLKKVNNLLTL